MRANARPQLRSTVTHLLPKSKAQGTFVSPRWGFWPLSVPDTT